MEKYLRRKAKVEARGIRFLATRFAAKEAFSKAIGMGMRMPMTWRAMQVLNAPSGKPVVVCGALQQWMQEQGLSAHVTITDEVEYAVAFVIVEKS
jgi:holo-[acyl-carrier protein] synthase